jgi:hypothetical protein
MGLKARRTKEFENQLAALANDSLDAVETYKDIRSACVTWQKKFKEGAERRDGIGGLVWLQADLQTWGYFGGVEYPLNQAQHYWILFGKSEDRFRKNMIVEINPPREGINRNVQGIVARDRNGRRWLLHGGRLHPKGKRITESDFDEIYAHKRIKVSYSDRSTKLFHPVVCIDRRADEVQRITADFVSACHFVRLHYTLGSQAASLQKKLEDFAQSNPESETPKKRRALDEAIIDPKHARVRNHLAAYLNKKGVKHTNERIRGWGPDLIALFAKPILFEIKTQASASDIQKGLGQLLLYEKILKTEVRKILLLPSMPKAFLVETLREFGVDVLTYDTGGRISKFSSLRDCSNRSIPTSFGCAAIGGKTGIGVPDPSSRFMSTRPGFRSGRRGLACLAAEKHDDRATRPGTPR